MWFVEIFEELLTFCGSLNTNSDLLHETADNKVIFVVRLRTVVHYSIDNLIMDDEKSKVENTNE